MSISEWVLLAIVVVPSGVIAVAICRKDEVRACLRSKLFHFSIEARNGKRIR